MDNWNIYQTLGVESPDALGSALLQTEEEALQSLYCLCRGFYGLQLGELGGRNWLAAPFGQRGIIASEVPGVSADCRVDFTQLPFAPDSVDVLLLPHVVEFHSDTDKVLEEAYRILTPGGFLILLSFNSMSFFGMRHYLRRLIRQTNTIPWSGHFYSHHAMAHWLEMKNFTLITSHKVFYRPPFHNPKHLKQWQWFEKVGRALFSFMGASCFYVATKQVSALTPIRLRWETPPPVALKPVTHRTSREQIS